MAVYLYKPPTYWQTQQLEGSLRCSVQTCTVVYRQGGVWFNQATAGMGSPDVTACDVDADTGLRLFFTKPMVVPDTLYAGLSALQPADPSWTSGSLTLL